MIGKLQRKIILRAPVTAKNAEGGNQTTYPADTITTWGKVRQISRSRGQEANTTNLTRVIEVEVRYHGNSGVTKDYQLGYNSENYTIQGIENKDEDNRWLIITASTK